MHAIEGEVIFPQVFEREVRWGGEKGFHDTDSHKAIVGWDPRTEEKHLYGIVSKDYELIKHESFIEEIEDIFEHHAELDRYQVHTDLFNNGARMVRKYTFPHITTEVKKGDVVNLTFEARNSYDRWCSRSGLLGAFRLICTNGQVIGKKIFWFKRKHLGKSNQIIGPQMLAELDKVVPLFMAETGQWRNWEEEIVEQERYDNIMEKVDFNKTDGEEILKEKEIPSGITLESLQAGVLTLWIFYCILTQYISHKIIRMNKKIELEDRVRRAFFTG